MELWRLLGLIATVVGFIVTVWGLVAAFVAARGEYRRAATRIGRMMALSTAEKAADEARSAGLDHAARERLDEEWDQRWAAEGFVRPTPDNLVYLAQSESIRLLGLVLDATRRDLLVAGVGLLVSTAASVGALLL